MPTHQVTDPTPGDGGFNVFTTDPVLTEGVARWMPTAAQGDAVTKLTRAVRRTYAGPRRTSPGVPVTMT